MGERSAFHGAPRRVEALAYIIQRIEGGGTSPSYAEVGRAMRPRVKGTRVAQFVEQLVRLGAIERDIGSRRGIRIRDAALCQRMIAAGLRDGASQSARPIGEINVRPYSLEQLPVFSLILQNPEDK